MTRTASVRKNVTLSLGLLAVVVDVHSARTTERSNTSVCVNGHEPAPIKQTRACSACGDINPATVPARKVAGGYVVLDTRDTPVVEHTHTMAATAHPAADLDDSALYGGSTYYLVPAIGQAAAYEALRRVVAESPHVALVARWASRTVPKTYRIAIVNGLLGAVEITTDFKPAPEIAKPTTNPNLMAEQGKMLLAMPGMVTSFDRAAYADQHRAKVAATLAASTPVGEAPVDQQYQAVLAALTAQIQGAK